MENSGQLLIISSFVFLLVLPSEKIRSETRTDQLTPADFKQVHSSNGRTAGLTLPRVPYTLVLITSEHERFLEVPPVLSKKITFHVR